MYFKGFYKVFHGHCKAFYMAFKWPSKGFQILKGPEWSLRGSLHGLVCGQHGSWYASSNRCCIYHCNAAGRIDSRCVVHYVWEPEECIPRCDIYDIHVIGGLVDRQLLSSARDSCG